MKQPHLKCLLREGETMSGKNILFVSYRHKDAEYLESVTELLLKNTDYAIWYDDYLSVGEKFDDEIKGVIRRSIQILQLVTTSYFEEDSYTYLKEVPYAKENGIKTAAVCMVSDENLKNKLRKSMPDFSCDFWDNDSVKDFLLKLNQLNVSHATEDKIRFCQKKVNCEYITAEEMFLLADAFVNGMSVNISREDAIRYARIASVCEIDGAIELLGRLEDRK